MWLTVHVAIDMMHAHMHHHAMLRCVLPQIYVFCCAHAAQVQAYLQDSNWLSERHCKARFGDAAPGLLLSLQRVA